MKNKDWGSGNRVALHEVLPLDTPYSLVIGASNKCNFRCTYCIHALSGKQLKQIGFDPTKIMEFELFKKIISDIKSFPGKIKSLQFLRDGEPLLNNKLPEMIREAQASDKFERVELITNGALLNPETNLKLINAGLDTIRISLQGMTGKKYKEITGQDIDINKFVDNIRQLYNNKEKCKIHIKMIDVGNGNDIEKFHRIFENICDETSIQYTIPYYNQYIDYSAMLRDGVNLFGNEQKKVEVCSRPFMSISVSADGTIMPCCSEQIKYLNLGNAYSESIFYAWNCEKLADLRILQLQKRRSEIMACKDCCLPDKITYDADNLDNYAEKLLGRYVQT